MESKVIFLGFAILGNLALFLYAIRSAFLAYRSFRNKSQPQALRYAAKACAIAGLALLLPASFIDGGREFSHWAVLICWAAAAAVVWKTAKWLSACSPTWVFDLGVVGFVAAFAFTGNWTLFWIAAIVMAAVWIAARKSMPKKPELPMRRDSGDERLHDPHLDFYGPELDLANPYRIGRD